MHVRTYRQLTGLVLAFLFATAAGAQLAAQKSSHVLKFAAFEPLPEAVELRIARPGEAAPRTFRWRLQ